MAEPDVVDGRHDAGGKDAPSAGKKQHHDSQILIVLTLGVLIVTYLLYRSHKAATASTVVPTSGFPSAGLVAGQGSSGSVPTTSTPGDPFASVAAALQSDQQAQAQALGGFQTYLSGLAAELATLTSSPQQAAGAPQGLPAPIQANAGDYPTVANPSTRFDVIGAITGKGGQYTGANVSGGAPVYANIGGQWQQDFSFAQAPIGTQVAVPSQFAGNVQGGVVTEQFG